MKKIGSAITVFLLFLIGLGVLLYPTISDRWNKWRSNKLVNEYEAVIQETGEDEIRNLLDVAHAYNSTLLGNTLPDAFAELQLPPDATYDSVLDPAGSGYMGTVDIPKINVDLPIYHYTTPEVLERGAGHLAGSSLPVGGESTHCVVSAHRGLPSAMLFTDLDKLKEGDTFFLHTLGETLAYEVDLIKTIEPTDTSDLTITRGEDYCTLFTCTPYAVNTHRLLVRGHRVPYTEEVYKAEEKNAITFSGPSPLIQALCVVAGLVLALLFVLIMKKRRDRKERKKARREANRAAEDAEADIDMESSAENPSEGASSQTTGEEE